MKYRPIILSLVAALVLSVIAQLVLAPRAAHAVDIRNYNAATIEGANICAQGGSLANGDPLVFDGTQWCNSIPFSSCLNFRDSGGNPVCEIVVENANDFDIGAGNNPVRIHNTSPFQVGTAGEVWNAGTDLTEVNAPRSTVNWFLPGNLATQGFGDYINTVPITVRSITASLLTAAVGCTTSAVVQLQIGGVNQATTAITFANGSFIGSKPGLALTVTAAQSISVQETTAPSGCTTIPANENYTVEYTTN